MSITIQSDPSSGPVANMRRASAGCQVGLERRSDHARWPRRGDRIRHRDAGIDNAEIIAAVHAPARAGGAGQRRSRPDGEPGALLIARKGGAVVRPSPQPQQAMV